MSNDPTPARDAVAELRRFVLQSASCMADCQCKFCREEAAKVDALITAARAEVASEVDDWRHRHATEQELRLMYEKALRDLECLSRGVALSGPVLGRVVAVDAQCRADERAQLAARATDQERGMVRAYGVAECQATVHAMRSLATENRIERLAKVTATETTLLAALTASRERGIEECADSVLVGECGDLWCVWLGGGAYVWGFSGLLAKRQAETLAAGIQRSLRALAAPAVADTTAPQRAEES